MPRSSSARNQHSRTRSDHSTEVAEDYVEAIAQRIQDHGVCRAMDLARQFAVSHVTVNRTVSRLQRDGLVTTTPYAPIELTAKGRKMADASAHRHDIVYRFLLALGVDEQTARVDSEGMEHHVSPETLQRMQQFIAEQTPESK
ncbi:MAG: manganese-binding transcriptional regulator MntR [Planctomycetaceae bacterium]|nr:manganese-binding transcriptional regulator MntR [Planctomycetaceae bacterium]